MLVGGPSARFGGRGRCDDGIGWALGSQALQAAGRRFRQVLIFYLIFFASRSGPATTCRRNLYHGTLGDGGKGRLYYQDTVDNVSQEKENSSPSTPTYHTVQNSNHAIAKLLLDKPGLEYLRTSPMGLSWLCYSNWERYSGPCITPEK